MGEAQPLIFDIEEESIDDLLQDSPKTEETNIETDDEDSSGNETIYETHPLRTHTSQLNGYTHSTHKLTHYF